MRGGALGFVPLLALLLALPEDVSGRVPSLGSLRQLEGQLEALEAEVVDEALERRREKVLHVVVSTPEWSPPPDPSQAVSATNSGENIMAYVEAAAKKHNDLIFSYDWGGSVTTEGTPSMPSLGSKSKDKDVTWTNKDSLKESWWYHGFKMAVLAQIKVYSQLEYDRVDLIGIEPSHAPGANVITNLEQEDLSKLVDAGHDMMKDKGVNGLEKLRTMSFNDFKTEFPK